MNKLVLAGIIAASVAGGTLATVGLYEVLTPSAHIETTVEGTSIASGTFVTPDPTHPASGSFEIISDGSGGRLIKLNEDFSIVAAPDPHIRINGKVIAKVTNVKGSSVYPIPNFIGEIEEVHAWCEIADVSLGNTVFN